jgi:hypothetical protein
MALVFNSAAMAADTARASYAVSARNAVSGLRIVASGLTIVATAVSALKTAGNAVTALRIVAIRRSYG